MRQSKMSRKLFKKASCFLKNYSAQKLNTDLRAADLPRLFAAVDLVERLATRFALEATRFLVTAALLVVLFFIVSPYED